MNRWNDFIESLQTPGGNIFLLTVLCLLFTVVALVLVFVHGNETAIAALIAAFSSVIGALIAILSGKERRAVVTTAPPTSTSPASK